MADESRIHAAVAVKLLFEGKNHQCLVDVLAQQPHPSLPPGPELRANIVDDGNPALAHLPRHSPVESGRIDNDSEVRPAPIGLSDQPVKQPIDSRKMADDLGDA